MSEAIPSCPLPLQTLDTAKVGVISFTTVKGPFGWLGNMAPFPIVYRDLTYRTPEALFQCLRFEGEPEIQQVIREQRSPMAAKWKAGDFSGRLKVPLRDAADLDRMRLCLRLKLEQHPALVAQLAATGSNVIVEDCTARPSDREIDGGVVPNPFWGMNRMGSIWRGNNALGVLWMDLRNSGRCPSRVR